MTSKFNEFLLEQRAYIKIRSLLGDTPRNIHQDLVQVYGGEACSESIVKKWSLRFREGRVSVEDDPRMGQPIIATTANNIALVAEMCDSDPHITIEQSATSLTLSTGSVHAILTKHLDSKEDPGENCKKLLEKYDQCDERRLFEICTGDETWIRYSEPTRKEQNKVWIVKGVLPQHYQDQIIGPPK
ncbi:Transposase [Oopsacas minuta]|uniref:Transposase n=1 Tax=Oopsacas minuta TaxID=111878 RepID=A0AAV7JR64_9METZ|nr:Transposase [Oopsacas minuta]